MTVTPLTKEMPSAFHESFPASPRAFSNMRPERLAGGVQGTMSPLFCGCGFTKMFALFAKLTLFYLMSKTVLRPVMFFCRHQSAQRRSCTRIE